MKFQINSEIGNLKTVIMQSPGKGVLRCDPLTVNSLSWDAIPNLRKAKEEHATFVQQVRQHGTEVLIFDELLTQTLEQPEVKNQFIENVAHIEQPYVQPETLAALTEHLKTLSPSQLVDQVTHGLTVEELAQHTGGVSLIDWVKPDGWVIFPMTNILFTRDPAMILSDRPLFGRMYNRDRQKEPMCYRLIFQHHPKFSFWNGESWYGLDPQDQAPIEGGNCHRYSKDLVIIGINDRTSPQAVQSVAKRLFAQEAAKELLVLSFENPRMNDADPMGMYLHVDMFLNMIDHDAFLFYEPIEPLITALSIKPAAHNQLNIQRKDSLFGAIQQGLGLDSIRIIKVGGREGRTRAFTEQRAGSGGNTVNLAPGKLCIWDRNDATIQALVDGGIEVIPVCADELVKGGGGPRCSTMPLHRD